MFMDGLVADVANEGHDEWEEYFLVWDKGPLTSTPGWQVSFGGWSLGGPLFCEGEDS